MESSKLLLEIEYQIKQISDFVVRGNYSSLLGIESHSAALDEGWSEQCRELSSQLNQVANLIETEITEARAKPKFEM